MLMLEFYNTVPADRCKQPLTLGSLDTLTNVVQMERQKTSDPHLHYFSAHRQALLARVLHTVAASCLLVIPTMLLYVVQSQNQRLAIIAVYTIAFATTVAVFTKARRHEIFASTAA